MIRNRLAAFALCILAVACSRPAEPPSASAPPPAARAPELTAQSLAGDWSGMLSVPGGPELPVIFHITSGEAGALSLTMDSPDQGAIGLEGENPRIENGTLKADFSFIGARFVAEPGADADTLKAAWIQGLPLPLELRRGIELPERRRPQNPAERPYVIEAVSFPGGAAGVTLAGELTLPPGEGPFAGVVLITGSGPQDRDETLMEHKPFLVLSDHLTRAGYAVLRYDDRGVAGSTGDFGVATTADFAADAAAALAFLKADPRVDAGRTAYVGHSEGGIVAPLAAGTEPPAAMVLLAGPTRTLAEVALFQTRELMAADGARPAQIEAAVDGLSQALDLMRQGEPLDQVEARTAELYKAAGLPEGMAKSRAAFTATPWMAWVMDYDPVPALAAFPGPVLALFGSRDLQVSAGENAPAMRTALGHPGSQVLVLDGLNHLFQPAVTGSMSEYARIETTIDPAALDAVTGWLDVHLRNTP